MKLFYLLILSNMFLIAEAKVYYFKRQNLAVSNSTCKKEYYRRPKNCFEINEEYTCTAQYQPLCINFKSIKNKKNVFSIKPPKLKKLDKPYSGALSFVLYSKKDYKIISKFKDEETIKYKINDNGDPRQNDKNALTKKALVYKRFTKAFKDLFNYLDEIFCHKDKDTTCNFKLHIAKEVNSDEWIEIHYNTKTQQIESIFTDSYFKINKKDVIEF